MHSSHMKLHGSCRHDSCRGAGRSRLSRTVSAGAWHAVAYTVVACGGTAALTHVGSRESDWVRMRLQIAPILHSTVVPGACHALAHSVMTCGGTAAAQAAPVSSCEYLRVPVSAGECSACERLWVPASACEYCTGKSRSAGDSYRCMQRVMHVAVRLPAGAQPAFAQPARGFA